MPKILIVDDQRNMRTTLAMMLRGASYEVDEAADGEQLTAIHARALKLVADQYRCLNDVLLPALHKAGIAVLGRSEWSPQTEKWLEEYFVLEV